MPDLNVLVIAALAFLIPSAARAQDGQFTAPDGVNKCVMVNGTTTQCTLIGVTGTITIPRCDDGWALLTYPGTATAVCAHDLKPPR